MKKLINRPGAVVTEMMAGLLAAHPGLAQVPGKPVLVRADAPEAKASQVGIVSGGGSGHEPAHAGYVGRGMLSAAVLGEVFTSPPPDAVLAAIKAVAGPRGVLLIVKNYTGDRLNFGLAAELARSEGIKIETVVVADDLALAGTPEAEHVGRRGLAGTVLVHKVAGAAAEAGLDLVDVAAEARATAESLGTLGVALAACSLPGAAKPSFHLAENEVELGLGIHGEPGFRKDRLEPADAMVDRMIDHIAFHARFTVGERIALLVNNLGSTPSMELAIVARRAVENLEGRGVRIDRVYTGTFLTALEMAGISLSILRVDDHRLERLDAATDAPAWPNQAAVARPRHKERVKVQVTMPEQSAAPRARAETHARTEIERAFEVVIHAVADALGEAESRLNDLDRAVGDGDLGMSLARGAEALRSSIDSLPLYDPSLALHAIGLRLQDAIGGTSGPLYAVFFLRAASHLRNDPDRAHLDPVFWAEALRQGCQGIVELGGAGRGDRTMLDALMPACDAFEDALAQGAVIGDAIAAAADAAQYGASESAELTPRRGRSSYLGSRAIGHPDPGAVGVALWTRAIARIFAEPAD